MAWVLLQPLMASLIFAFVFGVIARMPSAGLPYLLFAFAGMITWNLFSQTVSRASGSLLGNAHIISKVYFPRLILPLAAIVATLFDFTISLGLMSAFLAYYRVWPGAGLLLLPVWVAILVAMAAGIGLLAGALMVRYRDIGHIIPTASCSSGLYITPVAWSTLMVPGRFRWVFLVNPLSGLLDAIRWSLLGEGGLSPAMLCYSTVTAGLIFWLGASVFKRQERNFADVI